MLRQTAICLLLLAFAAGCSSIPKQFTSRDQSARTGELVEGSTLYRILPAGAIPAIDDPRWSTAAEASEFMAEEEPVIVYSQGDEVRIYSTWALDNHEVVNDYVGETAIAVTW